MTQPSDAAHDPTQATRPEPEEHERADEFQPRKRRRWLTGLLVLFCLLLVGLLVFGIWLNSVATARYEADLMSLVPEDVVLTAELRRLDDPRRGRQGSVERFTSFFDVLAEDPVFKEFVSSQAGRDAFGDPPLWERVDRAIQNVRDVESPLDTFLGSLDPKEDFLSGEAVVGLRPRAGAAAHPAESFELALDSLGTRSDSFALVRVSGRIKVYVGLTDLFAMWSEFEQHAPEGYSMEVDAETRIVTMHMPAARTESLRAHYHSEIELSAVSSTMRRVLRLHPGEGLLELLPSGEDGPQLREAHFNELAGAFADPQEGQAVAADLYARSRILESIHFALLDDVLAIATEEQLMRDIHALGQQRGRGGESLWEGPRLSAAYDAAAADAGAEVVEKALARIYVDADRLDSILPFRHMLDPQTHLDLIEATERMAHTVRAAAIDPESLRAGLFLVNVTNDAFAGPMLIGDSYLVHDTDSVDELLVASLEQERERSRISDLMSAETFAYVGLSRDLNELREQIERAVVGETSELLDYVRMLLGTDHFGNEIGAMFARHPLERFRPNDGHMPLFVVALELHERHRDSVAQDPITLAHEVLGEMIPEEQQDEVDERFFTRLDYRGHPVVYLYRPDDPNAPVGPENNTAPRTLGLDETLGPGADPAYAVIEGFVVIAASLELLERAIDAAQDGSRLRNASDLGAAANHFVSRGSVLEGVLDLRGMYRAHYRTPYEVRLLTFAGESPGMSRLPERGHAYPEQRREMMRLIENSIRIETHNRQAYLAAKQEAQVYDQPEAAVRAGHLAERLLDQLDNFFTQQELPFFVLPRFGELVPAMEQAMREAPGNPAKQEELFADQMREILLEIVERNEVQRMTLGMSTQLSIRERAEAQVGEEGRRADIRYEELESEELAQRKNRWRAQLRHEQHERDEWVASAGAPLVPWLGLQLTAPTPPAQETRGATTSHLRLLICLGDGRHH